MEKIIEHSGVVERVENDTVFVKITAGSACGACRAREACGMGESQDKTIAVMTPDVAEYAVGQDVTVGVKRRMGGMAVVLAYVGALVVLLVALIVSIAILKLSEGAGAGISLLAVAAYYVVLWLARHKIENKIHFTITKR
ncbi:MAG: SoxR reducing system RseC family protein [Alistipes sp.]